MTAHQSLYDKLCSLHTVKDLDDEHILLYVDFHILNEYTSPQAFTALRNAGRKPRNSSAALAVVDHVNPTRSEALIHIKDTSAKAQIDYLATNCAEYSIKQFGLGDKRQGIEHVVAPEYGFILPGNTIVCGDSHTTTYGAFGALGFGIGTSDVEHALATQTLVYRRLKNMRIRIDGTIPIGVTAKDIIMKVIHTIGASGATGYAVEFSGSTIQALSMEGRMTLCNMAMESGARAALIAPDEKTIQYLKGLEHSPTGSMWEQAVASWKTLYSDSKAIFEREIDIDASHIEPLVTWGTSPDQVASIKADVPTPDNEKDPDKRTAINRALQYMGLKPGMAMQDISINHVFIGSCTNSRIEDLRAAAHVIKGKTISPSVTAIIVPGSKRVKEQAEKEGLATIFQDAGFEWRLPGCSMCLAMNDDVLEPATRCASSTNRNFEGRQGRGARTHLMSPAMAAAAAVAGRLIDVREVI